MHGYWQRERCGRGPRRGGEGDWSDWRGAGHRWGHRHGVGMRRMFDQGDLKFVVLALIAEQPRHGYELIKEIERRVGGAYAPSPGVIYPLLTMLEEMGLARLEASDGPKKSYAITPEGEAELAANKAGVEALFERIAAAGESFASGRAPQVLRAMENLKLALRLRLGRGPMNDEQIAAVAAALDAAAQAIERA
jgi:DNA-binding PadR family transcriptional regulator